MGRVTGRVLRAVLAGTLGASFQFGFSTGFVNNTEIFIRHYFWATGVESPGDNRHFNMMWSLAVSGFAIGGFLGTLVFPEAANRIGRKRAILATTAFCYASCLLIAFPSGWMSLFLGRVMVGIGAGGACAAVPMYISEIAPVEARGTLGTVHQLMITIGILVAQGLSTTKFQLLGDDRLWQYMMLVPGACTTFLLLVLPSCADSPVYVLSTSGEEKALETLRWFRGEVDEDLLWTEVEMMKEELSLGSSSAAGLREILGDPGLLGPVLVGIGVNLSMQLSGIDAVLYYSTRVFLDAGIALEWAQVYTTLVSLLNVLVTLPAMLLMDRAGRKAIQLLGLGGMCVAYIVMTVALVTGQHTFAVGAMFLIVCFFAFGPGCIAWFIIAELIPIHARGVATTLGLGANWFANWLVAFVFPHVLAYLHVWTFSVFAVSTFGLSIFTVLCLPETKGKSVAEISRSFSSKSLPEGLTRAASTNLPKSASYLSEVSTCASAQDLAAPLLGRDPGPPCHRGLDKEQTLRTAGEGPLSTVRAVLPKKGGA